MQLRSSLILTRVKSRAKLEETGTIVNAVSDELENFYAPFNADLKRLWPEFDAARIK